VRITDEKRPYLKKLARLFEISRIEDLWMPDLIVFKVKRDGPALTGGDWQEELVPYAQKLVLLLASGEHEYLKELIDRLYRTLTKDRSQEPERETFDD